MDDEVVDEDKREKAILEKIDGGKNKVQPAPWNYSESYVNASGLALVSISNKNKKY